jgi:transposase
MSRLDDVTAAAETVAAAQLELLATMILAHGDGLSLRRIAAAADVSHQTVANMVANERHDA